MSRPPALREARGTLAEVDPIRRESYSCRTRYAWPFPLFAPRRQWLWARRRPRSRRHGDAGERSATPTALRAGARWPRSSSGPRPSSSPSRSRSYTGDPTRHPPRAREGPARGPDWVGPGRSVVRRAASSPSASSRVAVPARARAPRHPVRSRQAEPHHPGAARERLPRRRHRGGDGAGRLARARSRSGASGERGRRRALRRDRAVALLDDRVVPRRVRVPRAAPHRARVVLVHRVDELARPARGEGGARHRGGGALRRGGMADGARDRAGAGARRSGSRACRTSTRRTGRRTLVFAARAARVARRAGDRFRDRVRRERTSAEPSRSRPRSVVRVRSASPRVPRPRRRCSTR